MCIRALTVLAFVACAAPAFAQTPEHLAAVQRASAVGQELYEHDQAAWHGTDAMLADISDPRGEGLSGWITERTPDGVQVLFLKPQGERVTVAYRALWRDGELREHGRIDQPLTEVQARIDRARRIAIAAALPQQCAQRYNTVTLPRAAPGANGADVDVYLMPAMTTNTEIPFGGHLRLGVDTSAGAVRERQSFTTSCMTMEVGDDTAGLVISQVIGDTPTEIHVFESLTARLRVNVVSRSGHWSIDGRTISYVDSTGAN